MLDFCSLVLLTPYLLGFGLLAWSVLLAVVRWVNFDERTRAIRLGWVILACCGLVAAGLGIWQCFEQRQSIGP